MRQWAEIINGRVRHVFETSDDFTPEFGPPITVEEITGRSPRPIAGWAYDESAGAFTPSVEPEQPADDDESKARALVETAGPFLADQEADALRLILRKLYEV